jgi:hypothetical protein
VAEGTSFVAIYRELLVVQHRFAEQLDLLDLIFRRPGKPLDRPCLDAVDLGLELGNLLLRLRRERCGALHRARRVCAHGGDDYDRCKRQNRARPAARAWISERHGGPLCWNRRFGSRLVRCVPVSTTAANAAQELLDLAVSTTSNSGRLRS